MAQTVDRDSAAGCPRARNRRRGEMPDPSQAPSRLYIKPRAGYEDDEAEWEAIADRMVAFVEAAIARAAKQPQSAETEPSPERPPT